MTLKPCLDRIVATWMPDRAKAKAAYPSGSYHHTPDLGDRELDAEIRFLERGRDNPYLAVEFGRMDREDIESGYRVRVKNGPGKEPKDYGIFPLFSTICYSDGWLRHDPCVTYGTRLGNQGVIEADNGITREHLAHDMAYLFGRYAATRMDLPFIDATVDPDNSIT